MKNKGRMLAYLSEQLHEINILPVFMIDKKQYIENKIDVIHKLQEYFVNYEYAIVRSSSIYEDTASISNAGKFDSILNVKLKNPKHLSAAIDKVFLSYGNNNEDEEVLVQPMLLNVVKSGVVFTSDSETFSDYYTVNYKDGTNTEAVTAGYSNDVVTFCCYKKTSHIIKDMDMRNLISVCRSIENFLKQNALDIEFGINDKHEVYIFQVRPIASGCKPKYNDVELSVPLNRIYQKIKKLNQKHPFLLGNRTFFGVMPDWNPAEIIGVRPKKLALSLYKELITDSVWAKQRKNYGYRDVTMHPLMVSMFGIPYIDTRITFNSFIPALVSENLAERLVNYYLDRLENHPNYHDKIEFNIVFSCYHFNIDKDLQNLMHAGFSDGDITELKEALLLQTKSIINPHTGIYKNDLKKLQILQKKYEEIMNYGISTIDTIYFLIEGCKRYGTLPFAGVARAAFMAMQILNSLVSTDIITQFQRDEFLGSLHTVAKIMKNDVSKMHQRVLSKNEFLKKYGHIRPGTYDINSPRYDEAFDNYFSEKMANEQSPIEKEFSFDDDVLYRVNIKLEEHGFELTAKELLLFIKEAIEGRELLKFEFTKYVSEILRQIEMLGKRTGISKADMSYLDISIIKNLYLDLYYKSVADVLMHNISSNKKQYVFLEQLKLPDLILNPNMVYKFFLMNEEPNFITQKEIVAKTVMLSDRDISVMGKIVFIPAADPGYDFLFDKHIGGLITQFGGVNSHMAIRCAEMGIPAVIGAGEKKFKEWSKADVLRLDCRNKQVIMLDM